MTITLRRSIIENIVKKTVPSIALQNEFQHLEHYYLHVSSGTDDLLSRIFESSGSADKNEYPIIEFLIDLLVYLGDPNSKKSSSISYTIVPPCL